MDYDLNEQFIPCPSCGQGNSTHYDICQKCGHIPHAKSMRWRGAISLVLGLLLVGGMGYLMLLIADIMRHSADPGATTRFNGTPAQAAAIFAVLAFVWLFGVVSVVTGAWMLRYGRRSEKLKRIVLIFGAIFWLACLGLLLSEFF